MVVIAGCIIVKDDKVLMVQEASKDCYGLWTFPAGHLDEPEKITDAAIREVYEETGFKVKLTGVLPLVLTAKQGKEPKIQVRFTAEVIEESKDFNKEEILDVKWIEINKVKEMTNEELRGYDVNMKLLDYLTQNKIYPLELFDESNIQ